MLPALYSCTSIQVITFGITMISGVSIAQTVDGVYTVCGGADPSCHARGLESSYVLIPIILHFMVRGLT